MSEQPIYYSWQWYMLFVNLRLPHFAESTSSKIVDGQVHDETHRNATMSLLLPGKIIHLNAQLALRKFSDRGNKAGAVRGFQELQSNNLGTLIAIKPQRGTNMVHTVCNYFHGRNQGGPGGFH